MGEQSKQLMHKRQKTSHQNSSLRPICIKSGVCAVECQDKHVYIFPTQDLSRDLEHHVQGTGAAFTSAHPPTGEVTLQSFHDSFDDIVASSHALAEEYKQREYTVCCELELSDTELAAIHRMRLSPVTIRVHTYILELTPCEGCTYPGRYIGKTQSLTMRIHHHEAGTGAKFSKVHPMTGIHKILLDGGETYESSRQHEDAVTLKTMKEYIERYGSDAWQSVRGGSFTALVMAKPHEID
jgi:predicted GIY-YIG superfamily endonuclease